MGPAPGAAGFRSWIGGIHDSTKWLVEKFGDVCLRETVVAHIRRLLATEFNSSKLEKTPAQFKRRMKCVEDHMNSKHFAAANGGSLRGLAKELLDQV